MGWADDREVIEQVTGVEMSSFDGLAVAAALAVVCKRLQNLERLFNDHSHVYQDSCHRGSSRGRSEGPSVPRSIL